MDRMGSHQPLVRPIQGHPTNAAHPNLAEIAGDLRGLGGGGVAFVSSVQSESLPRLLRSAGASVTDPEAKILRRFVPKLFAQGRQEFRPAELKLLTPDARIHLHLEHLAPHALGTGVLRHLCPHIVHSLHIGPTYQVISSNIHYLHGVRRTEHQKSL